MGFQQPVENIDWGGSDLEMFPCRTKGISVMPFYHQQNDWIYSNYFLLWHCGDSGCADQVKVRKWLNECNTYEQACAELVGGPGRESY